MIRNESGFTGKLMTLLTAAHKMLERCWGGYIKKNIPIDKSVVLFNSKPDFADNARALAEYMLANGYTKKYKIFFDVDNLSKYKDSVKGITFVSCKNQRKWYKLQNMRLMITAGYTMFTHGPILSERHIKPEQYNVCLWHGCGYKDRSSNDNMDVRKFDMALVPGELFVKPKSYYWNVDEKYISPIGYPRYNWLMSKSANAEKLIRLFKNTEHTKVVIWMPTFRNDKQGKLTDSKNISQFPLVADEKQWKELDTLCQEKDIVLLVKLHRIQPDYGVPYDSFINIKKINDDTFEDHCVQMYEFLAQTDALISDYSSVAVDYLIVDRPIAFALQDYEEYKRTRGFVFDDPREFMPGHHLYSFQELKPFLSDVSADKDPYRENRKQMFNVAITRSDDYCLDVLNKVGIYK